MDLVQTSSSAGALSPDDLRGFQSAFDNDPAYRAAMNAVTTTTVTQVALNRRKAALVNHSFSVHLPENPATSQKSSGRCWMFAALNTFRTKAQQVMNMEAGFEFSQNYILFWDKLEKANYFLENILATLDEPEGSRLLDWLMVAPQNDGGQWDMFVNLIQKYGVVPKSVMPETESSSSTGRMADFVTTKLREYACRLRGAHRSGASEGDLREQKQGYMTEVYRMLCIHLGEPPSRFQWQWRDKDRVFHRAGALTPQEFYAKYVGVDLSEMVCLIHDPRPGHDFNRAFTVKFLGNVVGGRPTEYLNVELDVIKQAAIKQLQAGDSVWFGCDVGKHLHKDLGVMDLDLYDFDLVYGTTPAMSKAERLMYGQSLMTHAMVFTGVDLSDEGRPSKWRVENSWSAEPGDKGFFQMTDRWFDEYTYEVVVSKNHVPGDSLRALEAAPVELEPWDPMGSLA
ncbi:aminopeptidase C [Fimbriimonas ginsengisoli]|uniref:Aminopeptidase n=1 Tax=Fimbriimonas ginsengisoli Gsoil 348 TaxID=661478 RepID=A0A068NVD5_FIMGI|nr:C1 family peptidase [Fimbriimonas ginsengisoli]AIE87411.1 cysteine aminopeptidase [Fimbriimonas ginsengisoli Gsoil 348]